MTFFDIYALIILFAFVSVLVSKTIQTSTRGNQAIALGKQKKGLDKLLEFSFAIGLMFFIYLAIISIFQQPLFGILPLYELFDHLITSIIGAFFLTASIIFFSTAVYALNDAWRFGIDKEKKDKLITHGIFRITRNPTYLSLIFMFFGFFMLYSNFFFLFSTAFITFALHHQIKREEELLHTFFKDHYQDYCKKTPRYLFFKKYQ